MDGEREPDEAKVRRVRNIAVALVLGGLVVLFFLMTIVKLTAQFGP